MHSILGVLGLLGLGGVIGGLLVYSFKQPETERGTIQNQYLQRNIYLLSQNAEFQNRQLAQKDVRISALQNEILELQKKNEERKVLRIKVPRPPA